LKIFTKIYLCTFFNGISHSGTNVGFTIMAGNDDDGIDIGGMLQLGYQF